MKRFEFSLDRLLQVKRQLERIAELEQNRAREAVDAARNELQHLHDQLRRVSDHFESSIGRALSPSQWSAATNLSERLGDSIQVSQREVDHRESELLVKSRERAQLATEVEALDTLRRQQWDQWKREAQVADQERLDEFVQREWMARERDAELPAGTRAP